MRYDSKITQKWRLSLIQNAAPYSCELVIAPNWEHQSHLAISVAARVPNTLCLYRITKHNETKKHLGQTQPSRPENRRLPHSSNSSNRDTWSQFTPSTPKENPLQQRSYFAPTAHLFDKSHMQSNPRVCNNDQLQLGTYRRRRCCRPETQDGANFKREWRKAITI